MEFASVSGTPVPGDSVPEVVFCVGKGGKEACEPLSLQPPGNIVWPSSGLLVGEPDEASEADVRPVSVVLRAAAVLWPDGLPVIVTFPAEKGGDAKDAELPPDEDKVAVGVLLEPVLCTVGLIWPVPELLMAEPVALRDKLNEGECPGAVVVLPDWKLRIGLVDPEADPDPVPLPSRLVGCVELVGYGGSVGVNDTDPVLEGMTHVGKPVGVITGVSRLPGVLSPRISVLLSCSVVL